jgi:hypothetical protein
MTGGQMQLTAVGAQDLYLSGNPQITFFKAVYRRHTNFAIDTQDITFNTTPGKEVNNSTATLSNNGDLITKIWIEARFSQSNTSTYEYINWTNNTGAAYVEECYVKIGPHEIDRHTSTWLDVYNELTDHENSEHFGLNKHVAKNTYLKSNSNTLPNLELNIPLQFWFNRNHGLALPICALTQNEVKLHFKFRALNTLINKSSDAGGPITLNDPTVKLYADYVHLSSEEKRRFTHKPLEYLIETLQVLPDKTLENTVKLEFSHPVKEIIWIMNNSNRFAATNALATSTEVDATKNVAINNTAGASFVDGLQKNDYFNYLPGASAGATIESTNLSNLGQYGGSNVTEWFDKVTLKLNGSERSLKRNPYYYRHIQPLQAKHKIPSKHIYLYSFSLTPEDYSPSGTCNFTHVSSAELLFTTINGKNETTNTKKISIFAVTYNILRISGGRGGIAYSN